MLNKEEGDKVMIAIVTQCIKNRDRKKVIEIEKEIEARSFAPEEWYRDPLYEDLDELNNYYTVYRLEYNDPELEVMLHPMYVSDKDIDKVYRKAEEHGWIIRLDNRVELM